MSTKQYKKHMIKRLKKFKPNSKYSFKVMTLWVGVFAAIGVTTLLLTRAATPGITVTIDPTIANPTSIQAYGDDRVATVTWEPPANALASGIVGYYVTWGAASGQYMYAKQTTYQSAQIQPLINGTFYNVKVQSVVGTTATVPTPGAHMGETADEYRATGSVSTGIATTVTPSSARVDQLRTQMTGFFDDFNTPSGAFDELKWNSAPSGCVAIGTGGAFLNTQFHSHTMLRSDCDRGQLAQRPRAVFDLTNATEANPGIVVGDFDGISFNGRDRWYVDLVPLGARKDNVPMDITGHVSATETDTADPMILRMTQNWKSIGFFYTTADKIGREVTATFRCPDWDPNMRFEWCVSQRQTDLSPIPEVDLFARAGAEVGNISQVPNVRQHYVIKYSPTKITVFINSAKVWEGPMPPELFAMKKFTVQTTPFSYNTGKDTPQNPTTTMLHWDNFGFNGPAPTKIVHNYIDGGANGNTPYFGKGTTANPVPGGDRSLKIPVPDPIGSPVQARLMYTITCFGSCYFSTAPNQTITINGRVYPLTNPTDRETGTIVTEWFGQQMGDAIVPFSDYLLVNPADLKQGMNDISFFKDGRNGDFINVHLELEYAKGTQPTYTSPTTVFGASNLLSYIAPPMAPHDNYLFVEQNFGLPSGNISTPPPSTTDTTPPTISITAPTNNTTVTPGSITATVTVADNVAVTKVEYYIGSSLSATTTTAPFTATVSTSNLAAGTYTLKATAYDAANNTDSSTINFVIPTIATPSKFQTLPVGATLPSEASCASRVRSTPEIRPINATYNATKGVGGNYFRPLVTGNYAGTTDEIIQWAACKWGIDEDIFRGQAVKETYWFQNGIGDFTTDATKCDPLYPISNYPNQANGQCPESIGLYQVRWTYHKSAFYNSTNEIAANLTHNAVYSTAYNADYTAAAWRSCYNGEQTWLNDTGIFNGNTYAAGDVWGCVGLWVSGRWRDPLSLSYIADIQNNITTKIWEDAGFKATTSPNPIKTPPTTPTPTPKKCDFNNDSSIDSKDLFILLANFNKPVPLNTKGDCNSSSTVDSNDLFILLAGFGK